MSQKVIFGLALNMFLLSMAFSTAMFSFSFGTFRMFLFPMANVCDDALIYLSMLYLFCIVSRLLVFHLLTALSYKVGCSSKVLFNCKKKRV